MDVFKNSGTPKSSILIWFSIINHPFWGTPIFGNTHINTLNHSGFSDLFLDICKLLVFFFKKKAEIPVFPLSSGHFPMDRFPIEALRHLPLGDDISQPRSSFSEVS